MCGFLEVEHRDFTGEGFPAGSRLAKIPDRHLAGNGFRVLDRLAGGQRAFRRLGGLGCAGRTTDKGESGGCQEGGAGDQAWPANSN